MRKQLGMLAAMLALSVTALLWVGCSDRCCDSTAPVCEQPCEPVCKPVCPPPACKPVCPPPCKPVCPPPACKPACPPPACKPVCPPPACPPPACKPACPAPAPAACCEEPCKRLKPCAHPSTNELCCQDNIIVRARNPQTCLLGEQYPLEFEVRACQDVCDVVVTTHLPNGVTFIRSQPEAKVEGNKLTWNFGPMAKGECRVAKVILKCECEGELCACFCATATPVRFCALLCAKPILVCHKCGPEQVCPGDAVNYEITVTNKGSCPAEDVVITDNLPEGVDHASGQKTLTYKLGCLAPCETKKVNICTTAVKRGKFTNTAVVTACNADSTSCQSTVCVCCCGIECNKVGPKEVAIGKNADYQITVANTGDLPLTDLLITDCAPSSTSIVAANGAQINGNQAVWRLKQLNPGDKVNFTITLTTCTPGCFTNRVNVTNCQQCNASCEASTRWRGRPALNVCITDTEDPICIGDPTSYVITVVNQGQEADNNVVVVARFPAQIQPLSAFGDAKATVSGQTVTFAPVNNFGPRQTLKFRIDAKGVSSGDARVSVEVSSDSIKTPITQQESTIVN